jgi:CheY-like chemotaxis protein
LKNEIGIDGRGSHTDRSRLFRPDVHADVELSLVFRLQKPNDPVVLELLADGPHENWHKPAEYNRAAGKGKKEKEENTHSGGKPVRTKRIQGKLDRTVVGFHNGSVPSSADKPASRILIVDDDVSVTDTFSRMLRLEGYEVWAALSADEGLTLAQAHRPHAVILDLRMPLTSGVQFLRAIRAIPGLTTTPVAIVTGDYYLDEVQAAEIKALSAELRYKPLWLEELVTLARELLSAPLPTDLER